MKCRLVYTYLNCWGRPITIGVVIDKEDVDTTLKSIEDLVDYKVFEVEN